jgi:hypothetical protein
MAKVGLLRRKSRVSDTGTVDIGGRRMLQLRITVSTQFHFERHGKSHRILHDLPDHCFATRDYRALIRAREPDSVMEQQDHLNWKVLGPKDTM